MDKVTFFRRLSRWPKITFSITQVLTVNEGDLLTRELYVRDQNQPCSRLFICFIAEGEPAGLTEHRFMLWLEEFNSGRNDYFLQTRDHRLPASVYSVPATVATL